MCGHFHSDLLKPTSTPAKRAILVEDCELPSPDGGVSNPVFNDSDVDINLAEEGE